MALSTLKGVEKLGEFDVVVMDELREKYPEQFTESGAMQWEWFENTIRPSNFVYVRHDKNSIAFTLQNGPVKEQGVNGCQVDTIIYAARAILEGFQKEFPCDENKLAILGLSTAIEALKSRTRNREARGVEGISEL